MAAAPLKQLRQRELQERQASHLSLDLEEQIANEISFKGELDVRECGGVLDRRTQVVYLHREERFLMGFDEPVECRILHEMVGEISSEGEQHQQRTSWLGSGC